MENLENELEVYHDTGDGTGFHLVEQDSEQDEKEREDEGIDVKSAVIGAGVLTLVSLVVGGTVTGIRKLKKNHEEKTLEKARKLVAEADAKKKEQEPEPDFMNEPEEEESNETPEEE